MSAAVQRPLADGGVVGLFGQSAVPQGLHLLLDLPLALLAQQRKHDARTHVPFVAGGGVFAEVVEVVADLVGDAEVLAVGVQYIGAIVELASERGADLQRDFKGGCGLAAEDLQHLRAAEGDGMARPEQLGPLPDAQLTLAFRSDEDGGAADVRGGVVVGEEAVAFTNQQVADVQRDRDAVLGVQRGFSVALGITVLDVIMHERGFVEDFDGDRGLFDRVGNRTVRIFPQRLIGRHCEKGTPALAGAGQPFAGDVIAVTTGRPHERVEGFAGEPGLHLVMKRVEVQAARFVFAGEVDVIPDPVDIDQRVDAVVLEQGHGDSGDRGGFDVGEGALKNRQAGNANDGLDLARLDERHDDGAALGDEDGVTELFRLVLKVLDGAEAALLAEQAEFIKGRGALALHPQALRHQQQTLFKRDGGQGLAPSLVRQQHAHVVAVNPVDGVDGEDLLRVLLKLRQRHGRHEFLILRVAAHPAEDLIAVLLCLRDVFLRLTDTAVQAGDRRWKGGRTDGDGGHARRGTEGRKR